MHVAANHTPLHAAPQNTLESCSEVFAQEYALNGRDESILVAMKVAYVRLVAFALFVISFFLPAINMHSGGPGPGVIPGWTCAWFASLIAPIALVNSLGQGIHAEAIMLPASGLVNDLFLAICSLGFWPRLRRTRLVLAALMLPCFITTWVFFASSKTVPLVGHFLWIAACILVAVPDAVDVFRKKERSPDA